MACLPASEASRSGRSAAAGGRTGQPFRPQLVEVSGGQVKTGPAIGRFGGSAHQAQIEVEEFVDLRPEKKICHAAEGEKGAKGDAGRAPFLLGAHRDQTDD